MSLLTSLVPLTNQHRPAAERLWQLYVHDLSEFRGLMPGNDGSFGLGRLPTFFDDPDRGGYLIRSGSALAGFALVRGLSEEPKVVGEFFVVRAARRRHVGYEAALELFHLRPGRWEIPLQEENVGAARFWRCVAADTVGTAWTEVRRPVAGRPDVPPDTCLQLCTIRSA